MRTNFSRAYTITPLCSLARAATFSGLLPLQSEFTDNVCTFWLKTTLHLEQKSRSPTGRGGERPSATLPVAHLAKGTRRSTRLASNHPALPPKCSVNSAWALGQQLGTSRGQSRAKNQNRRLPD